jgi:hypothetical protein
MSVNPHPLQGCARDWSGLSINGDAWAVHPKISHGPQWHWDGVKTKLGMPVGFIYFINLKIEMALITLH